MKICAKCKGSFEEGIAYCPNDGSRLTTVSKLQEAGEAVPEEAVKAAAQAAKESGVEDLTGRTVAGRYQIIRRLGEGGMGIVYRAVDSRLEKEVAIKVLKEDFAHRTDVVARFTLEAKSAARIKHENVLDVTDYGQTEDGSFYIAMELLVGTDLADVLQKHQVIEPARAIAIMIQVTRALGAAHGKGIVHRDLKPENIFLVAGEDNREVVKIVDFGIAQMKDLSGSGSAETSRKLTRTGMIFGTPEYMSPEQAAGKEIDQRVDVYAVGVIMYETLAGRVPFVGDTFMGVLTQHMFENAPAIRSIRPEANVPPEVESIIAKALAKDPAHRYQSMQEVADDLVRIRDGQKPMAAGAVIPGVARPTAAGYGNATIPDITGIITPAGPISTTMEVEPPRSRRMVGLLAGLAAIVLVGGGAAVATSLGGRSNGGPPVVTANGAGGSTNGSAGNAATNGGANNPAVATPVAVVDAGVASAVHDAGSAQPASAEVTVHVATTPVTARIEVEGMTTLRCDATPCDLRLTRGQAVRLIATASHKRGELPITPDHDGETVSIAMNTVGGGHSSGHGSGGGNSGSSNAHSHSCRPGQLHLDPSTGLMVPCFMSGNGQ